MEIPMNLIIKIKPVVYSALSKEDLFRKINKYGVYDNKEIAYNIHKVNAKWKQGIFKSGPRKGMRKPSVKIRDKQWIAYVYRFDKAILSAMSVKVSQKDRNFVLGKAK